MCVYTLHNDQAINWNSLQPLGWRKHKSFNHTTMVCSMKAENSRHKGVAIFGSTSCTVIAKGCIKGIVSPYKKRMTTNSPSSTLQFSIQESEKGANISEFLVLGQVLVSMLHVWFVEDTTCGVVINLAKEILILLLVIDLFKDLEYMTFT